MIQIIAMSGAITGGCHCGFVRYELRQKPHSTGYCHCRTCQRTTGGPVLVWSEVAIENFSNTAGEPSVYRSSEDGERRFCPRCGSPLEFRKRNAPDAVEVYAANLDEPSCVSPKVHIFTADRIPWFDVKDDLPRFAERPGAGSGD